MRDPSESVREILSVADEKSRNHEWIEAASLYQRALLLPLDAIEQGRVTDLLAQSYNGAAFQSQGRSEFVSKMQQAKEIHEKAATIFSSMGLQVLERLSRCRALFAAFWLEERWEQRRVLVEKCVSQSYEILQLTKETTDSSTLVFAEKDLLTYSREAYHLSTEWDKRYREFVRGLELGRSVIKKLEAADAKEDLVEALHTTLWIMAVQAEVVLDPTGFEDLAGETIQLGRKLEEVSEKLGTAYVMCLSKHAEGDIAWDVRGNLEEAFALYREAVNYAHKANNRLVTGRLLPILADLQRWRGRGRDQTPERRELIEEALGLGNEAVKELRVHFHTCYLARASSSLAECLCDLATVVETDVDRKREHLLKAIDLATEGLSYERGTQEGNSSAHSKAKAIYLLSTITADPAGKLQLLKEALPLRQETVQLTDALEPHSWNRGVMRYHLALIKAELASLETDDERRRAFLGEAVFSMQQCVDICRTWAATVPGSAPRLARYWESYADILQQYYSHTLEKEYGEKSAVAYSRAIEHLNQAEHVGPLPVVRWKIAKLYDLMSDFNLASSSFSKASEEYKLAAQKIPGAASNFQELATYMAAWAEIEKARFQHHEGNHGKASRTYTKAVGYLHSTRQGAYLPNLVAARSILEKAEAYSDSEDHKRAVEYLKKTLKQFGQARVDIEAAALHDVDPKNLKETHEWLNIADHRVAYTHGRLLIEEAHLLDKNGDTKGSARQFGAAAAAFKALAAKTATPQEVSELNILSQFCECWARMREAESKSSPELYAESAGQFEKVSGTTEGPGSRLIALANSSICKALEFGTRFRITRNVDLYSDIKRHLETAADYFTEAGFRNTASWVRATQRLFDAHVKLTEAETAKDARVKTELYLIAEKGFELSAELFGEAGFPKKKEEMIGYGKHARVEKEALVATLKTLGELPLVTASVLSPVPMPRGPAPDPGLVEEARVVGEVRASETEVTIGRDFLAIVDMVNIGKTATTLLKMENVPPEGFETTAEGEDAIDLRGKRLEYLKTHQVKLTLKPVRKGVFEISPRIVFVDDLGNYRSTTLQSPVITIRELGLTDPTPTPPRVRVPSEVKFENPRSRDVFQYLVKAFVDDHMSKRIVRESAGWRSLMDVVRDLKIPRSAMYRPEGRKGPVLYELESRGFVDTRIFPGERGRGGDIRKVRVAYENTIVHGIVEKAVMENA